MLVLSALTCAITAAGVVVYSLGTNTIILARAGCAFVNVMITTLTIITRRTLTHKVTRCVLARGTIQT